SERDSINLDRAAAVGLPSAASCFDSRCRSREPDQPAAIEKPQQTCAVDPCEWFNAITAKKLQRPPPQLLSTSCPAFINEPPAVIDEAEPPLRRDVAGRSDGIKPCQ